MCGFLKNNMCNVAVFLSHVFRTHVANPKPVLVKKTIDKDGRKRVVARCKCIHDILKFCFLSSYIESQGYQSDLW